MNFFEHQDKARRNTKVLMVYLVLALVFIITAIYGVVMVIYNYYLIHVHVLSQTQSNPRPRIGSTFPSCCIPAWVS